jgi:hypothetical protein
MQPLDFCNLAERLIAREKNPEGYRSAISRAYYAAFLQAVDFLERMSVYLIGVNKHEQATNFLCAAGDPDINGAGMMLGDLRDIRNLADYELTRKDVETEAKAQQCVDNARDIIAKLNGCRIDPTRFAAVTAHVRARVATLRGLPPPSAP